MTGWARTRPWGAARAWPARGPRVRWTLASAGLAALMVTVLVATSIGPVAIAPGETMRILLRHAHVAAGNVDATHDVIVWQVRLPRVLTAALVGATLAASGASYQAVFRNPLADPYLIGVGAGAALGATLAITLSLPAEFYGFGYTAIFAFAGAMLAVGLTYELARVGRTVPPTTHILAGVAVSAAASAGVSMLLMLNEQRAVLVFSWLYGDFSTANWHHLLSIAPYVAACLVVLLANVRNLNVLQLGDDEAQSLGINVERVRMVTIVAASLATAVCVAISGLIGFVGLVVPHACRLVFGPDHRSLLPVSLVGGAIFLVIADTAARTMLSPQEVPVGVLTAAVGAPFFLLLLRRQRRGMLM